MIVISYVDYVDCLLFMKDQCCSISVVVFNTANNVRSASLDSCDNVYYFKIVQFFKRNSEKDGRRENRKTIA